MGATLVVGFCIGLFCGARVIGADVGETVGGGDSVGFIVTEVGFSDTDGWMVGAILGCVDGASLSTTTGFCDGGTVGSAVGGSVVGGSVLVMGRPVGRRVGAAIGRMVGFIIGAVVDGRD